MSERQSPGVSLDLHSLADAIAALVGGAVTIEDPSSKLLAYSSLDQPIDQARQDTILGRGHGADWAQALQEQDIMRTLISTPGTVVRVSDPQGRARNRLAASIGTQAELLGFVWVVEGDTPFTDSSEELLRDACPLAALHLLRQRANANPDRRERGMTLRQLLDGELSPTDAARGLGLDPAEPIAVAVFDLAVEDPVELSSKRTKAVDAITVAVEAFRRSVVCAWVGQRIYALLPSMSASGQDRLVGLVRSITESASGSLGVPVVSGIGSTVASLHDFAVSRSEADRVVEIMRDPTASQGSSGHIDALRVPAILVAMREILRDRPELRLPALDELAEHDRRNDTSFVETLRTYVSVGASASRTGAALNLHANSVRYRVERIEELTGFDLSAPETVQVLALYFAVTSG